MMDNKTITAQVLARAAQLQRQKAQRKQKLVVSGMVAASLVFVSCLALKMPGWMLQMSESTFSSDTAAASVFSSSPYLGYVVVGVVAFVLGALVTIVCYQWRSSTTAPTETSKEV